MKKNLTNMAILIIAIIIQFSLLPPIFSAGALPQIILVLVIGWTVILGFPSAFWWVILAGFVFDLASGQKIGSEIMILIFVSYCISFFSRRFLVENKFWASLILVGFVVMATIVHRFYGEFVFLLDSGHQFREAIFLLASAKRFTGWYFEIIYNIISFGICFWILKKFENKPPQLIKTAN
jgi:rod shape-determining protein MreD